MSDILRINLDDLLHRRTVESTRIEFKAGWDEQTTAHQVLKTICAFANDYQNLNGGYVVIGVAEREGRADLPPVGLDAGAVERAQRWLRGRCKALQPEAYEPVFSPEVVDDRHVLVVWAPASAARPHRAPDANGQWKYWIRIGPETIDAERSGRLEALLEQTARVPWDDRAALDARLEDLRESTAREYLRDVGNGLLDLSDAVGVYRRMHITTRVNGHEVPRNVGLLFFSDTPDGWFRGAKIEVVRFAADRAGDVQDERIFRGPLADQLRGCLRYLESLSHAHLRKERDHSQARGWVSYPQVALREALVNAVYHRAYREDVVEPTKVHLYPDRIEVISYPGPVPGIEPEHLSPGHGPPPVPARNRRIGEFLKELKLAEGRLTGLPKIYRAMEHNGSPAPGFDFDAGRSYFRTTLPAHPEYVAVSAIQDAAYLRTVGRAEDAFERMENVWKHANEASPVLAIEMIRLYADQGRWNDAKAVYAQFRERGSRLALADVGHALSEALRKGGPIRDARSLRGDPSDGTSSGDAMGEAQPQLAAPRDDR